MDRVYSIFEYMSESSWRHDIYEYFETEYVSIPVILTELYESSWSEDLEHYKSDILSDLGYYLSVKEMRDIYLTSLLQKVLPNDLAHYIVEMV